MSTTQPHLLANDVLARVDQLCTCCQRLTGELVRVRLAKEWGYREVYSYCEHYNSLQDLIDGTLGNCHLCVIVCDSIQHNCKRHSTQVSPLFETFKSFEPQGSSIEEASARKIITDALTTSTDMVGGKVDGVWVSVAIDDKHLCSSGVYVKLSHPLSAPERPYTEAQLSTRNASEAHYHLIRKWLDTCIDGAEHPACNTTSKFQRPTRLIDLNHYYTSSDKVEQQDVRLVEGISSHGDYAALSYCWGAVQQPTLLHTNLQQFEQRISFKDLTQVSRDAITVCRRLSIPFLWIDALCIIQGENGDFATEAPRMEAVYAGSTVTIVAADSKDTTEAFLVQRKPLRWLNCTLAGQDRSLVGKRFEARAAGFCQAFERRNKPGMYHIDSRAWCLQERFMSPRSIFFGRKGIHWECREGYACESDTDIRKDHSPHSRNIRDHLKPRHGDLHQGKLSTSEVLSEWGDLMDAYSAMHLSHPLDVLIAIAGIASIFEVRLGSKSTYGLWIDFLVKELLWWQGMQKYPRNCHYFAGYLPSWSWASAYGYRFAMFSANVMWDPDDTVDHYSANIMSWPADASFDIHFLQGPRDTRLLIRGYLSPHIESKQDYEYSASSPSSGRGGRCRWRRQYRPDYDAPKTDLFYLLLLCQYIEKVKEYRNYGLILTPVNKEERLYRRVGRVDEECQSDLMAESPHVPASSWVQGKSPVNLWAPLGEEQEIYIV